MARTVSAATTTKTSKVITTPYWLVFIDLTTPVYYTDGPTVIFDSHTWTHKDLQVIGLNPDKGTGTLKVENTDYVFGGLVSDENGISGISIKIYGYYA